MKLKPFYELSPWKVSESWPLCGECGINLEWLTVIPCPDCAKKYKIEKYFYDEVENND